MQDATRALEDAAWAAAEGTATAAQLAQLEADPRGWRQTLERMLDDVEDQLDSVRMIHGPSGTRWWPTSRMSCPSSRPRTTSSPTWPTPSPPSRPPTPRARCGSRRRGRRPGRRVGGRPRGAPADNGQLADRLEAIGGPKLGWSLHADVVLPTGTRAAALSIPVDESLGWLVAVGGGLGRAGVGASVTWLGRVAVEAVRLVARARSSPRCAAPSALRARASTWPCAGRRPWSTPHSSTSSPPPCRAPSPSSLPATPAPPPSRCSARSSTPSCGRRPGSSSCLRRRPPPRRRRPSPRRSSPASTARPSTHR